MKIAVSSDEHTHLVDYLLTELQNRGHETVYFGPSEGESSQDWPLVTLDAVKQINEGLANEAIVMCWTGTGCSIAANKMPGIRRRCVQMRKPPEEPGYGTMQMSLRLVCDRPPNRW